MKKAQAPKGFSESISHEKNFFAIVALCDIIPVESTTPYSTKVIRQLEEPDPKLKGVFIIVLEEIEKNVKETAKRTDFLELKEIVAELGKK